MSSLTGEKRTCYCGEVSKAHTGQEVVLKGWVHRRRDHGGVIFVDLRDRTGVCQVVLSPETIPAEQFEKAHDLRDEFVLAVKGTVRPRPEGTVNANLATGEIELNTREFEILNTSRPLPFRLDEYSNVNEDARLKYRFLDLRRPEMQKNFVMRHKLAQVTRRFLSDTGFLEFATPILTKSTPEGARDFLVPSRHTPGAFFALPQSPQLFKQLLMVAGYDRYFQIATCFRDEDLRANRQPEFTQIDIEMSFVSAEEVYELMEGLIAAVWKECKGIDVPTPFQRIGYSEAMLKYGSDKPDLRFDLPITDMTEFFSNTEIKVFANTAANRGLIRALRVPGGAALSRKQIDDYTGFAGIYGAKGLAWFKLNEGEMQSPLAKFLDADKQAELIKSVGGETGDIIFVVADREKVVCDALGQLRLKVAYDFSRPPIQEISFPYFEKHSGKEGFRKALEASSFYGLVVANGAELKKETLEKLALPNGLEWIARISENECRMSRFLLKRITGWKDQSPNEQRSSYTPAAFRSPELLRELETLYGLKVNDLMFISFDQEDSLHNAKSLISREAVITNIWIPNDSYAFAWVIDFPLFEYAEREKVFTPSHHPFTMPMPEDIALLDEYNADPAKYKDGHQNDNPLKRVRALAYDLACNGEELGGGSIRIHTKDVQDKVFQTIGITKEEADEKFGFLLDALSYGAPPHGGLAFGFERMLMLLLNEKSIREVIAFPKTQSGADLMVDAPSQVDAEQLKELFVQTVLPPPPPEAATAPKA